MKSCEGKTVKHNDGREGYVLWSAPREGKLLVLVQGAEERWGQDDLPLEELCRVRGIGVQS